MDIILVNVYYRRNRNSIYAISLCRELGLQVGKTKRRKWIRTYFYSPARTKGCHRCYGGMWQKIETYFECEMMYIMFNAYQNFSKSFTHIHLLLSRSNKVRDICIIPSLTEKKIS